MRGWVVVWACLAAGAVRAEGRGEVRIVSCAPAVTETLCDLGGEGVLVGRSSACVHPGSVRDLPSVGTYASPSLERILACGPTHVLMTFFTDPALSNRLERAGVRVLQFPCDRLADYAPMRARLARLLGRASRRVLAVVQREPLIVAGRGTLPDDVLDAAGCANAVTNRTGYFKMSAEDRARLAGDVDVEYDFSRAEVDDLTRLGPKLGDAIKKFERDMCGLSPRGGTGGQTPTGSVRSPVAQELFWLRIWRVLAGLIVGAALATAGTVLQSVLRNSLADPFVLGLSGGASLAAAGVLATGAAAVCPGALPAAAFAGALAALALVTAVARAAGGGRVTLILAGVVVAGVTSSVLMVLLSQAPSRALQSVTWWMMGDLSGVPPGRLAAAGACVTAAGLAVFAQARALNALALGGDLARTLGVDTRRTVAVALGAASLATACAVSLAGIIGFVGLIVPHAVRRVTGANHRALLPAAAFAGGVFLVACDQLGRQGAAADIPAGAVTALAGGPFFLWMLVRHARNQK